VNTGAKFDFGSMTLYTTVLARKHEEPFYEEMFYNLFIEGSNDSTNWEEIDVYSPSSFTTSGTIILGDGDSTINDATPLYKYLRLRETLAEGEVATCSWAVEIKGNLYRDVDVTTGADFTCEVYV